MNRTFIKVLPLAAAVLLATSCSKEDNNNEIVNNGQEKVEKQFKTITVKGNAGKKQGISKISLDEGTGAISFEKNDEILFSGDGVSGNGKFINNNGDFEAVLTFTENAVVTGVEISATIGTALTGAVVCETWEEVADYLYETSLESSTLKETGEGEYRFEKSFEMVPQIAILKNTSGDDARYSIGEVTNQPLAAGSILVVMSGTELTINGRTATVTAGKSYNIAAAPADAPTVEGSFALTVGGTVNYTISSSIQGLEYSTDGTSWSDLSSTSFQNLSSGAKLNFRTKKTSTAYASQVKEVTVPTVSHATFGDITLYYFEKEGEFVTYEWQDIAGISVGDGDVAIYTDADGNRYHIFEEEETRPEGVRDGFWANGIYTLKQILTVELNGMPFTYYAGDTWQTLAERNPYDEITVENGQVRKGLEIIYGENNEPVNPTDPISSDIRYMLQQPAD